MVISCVCVEMGIRVSGMVFGERKKLWVEECECGGGVCEEDEEWGVMEEGCGGVVKRERRGVWRNMK